jgi:hypothetical protein
MRMSYFKVDTFIQEQHRRKSISRTSKIIKECQPLYHTPQPQSNPLSHILTTLQPYRQTKNHRPGSYPCARRSHRCRRPRTLRTATPTTLNGPLCLRDLDTKLRRRRHAPAETCCDHTCRRRTCRASRPACPKSKVSLIHTCNSSVEARHVPRRRRTPRSLSPPRPVARRTSRARPPRRPRPGPPLRIAAPIAARTPAARAPRTPAIGTAELGLAARTWSVVGTRTVVRTPGT